jgi:hypothetical protein
MEDYGKLPYPPARPATRPFSALVVK